jgi:hypothetical protein
MCFRSVSLPLPFVQFFSSLLPHICASNLSHLWFIFFAHVPFRDSFVFRFMFSPLPVRFCFPYFLCDFFPLPFVQFFPSQFSRRLTSTDVLTIPRISFDFRFYCSFSELGCCGPRVANKRAHTPSPKQQSYQGGPRFLNLPPTKPQSTGNRG